LFKVDKCDKDLSMIDAPPAAASIKKIIAMWSLYREKITNIEIHNAVQ
jgi:hypothetical protein